MSFDWRAVPAFAAAVWEDGLPIQVKESSDVSSQTQEGALWVPLLDRAWIICRGDDATSFLHNQLTSDVNHLAVGHWQHSAWCSAKGRMLASVRLVRLQDSFALGVDQGLADFVLKRLRMFVLRSKVVLERLGDDWLTAGVFGPNASQLMADAAVPVAGECGVTQNAHGWGLRVSDDRFEWVISPNEVENAVSFLTQKGLAAGLAAWRQRDIDAGLVTVHPATQEEFVPQMVNFDKIGGVSFHKGCYPGQEVIARTQYLGKVKRHLYRVRSNAPIKAGVSLFSGSGDPAQCGIIAEAAPLADGTHFGLAVLLETALEGPIVVGDVSGPSLSSIELVAA